MSFMVMMALFPLPPLSSAIAFSCTWAVLGIRKALMISGISMIPAAFMSLTLIDSLIQPFLQQQRTAIAAINSCSANQCVTIAATHFNGQIDALLQADKGIWALTIIVSVWTLLSIYRTVRKIRAHTGSIKKFYWGPLA